MTSKIDNIDDILIGVFLTASLLFVVVWSIAMLKWRKKFLYRIFPCLPKKKKSSNTKQNVLNKTGNVNLGFSEQNLSKNDKTHDNTNQIYTIDLNNNHVKINDPVKIDYDLNQIHVESEVRL